MEWDMLHYRMLLETQGSFLQRLVQTLFRNHSRLFHILTCLSGGCYRYMRSKTYEHSSLLETNSWQTSHHSFRFRDISSKQPLVPTHFLFPMNALRFSIKFYLQNLAWVMLSRSWTKWWRGFRCKNVASFKRLSCYRLRQWPWTTLNFSVLWSFLGFLYETSVRNTMVHTPQSPDF